MSIPRRTAPSHPALVQHAEDRAQNVQNRIADTITRFAGSMMFVYVHIIWFGAWIIFKVEHYPFGLLTMIVSLEAIFLSTFVMISQNRADEKRRVLADHQVADRPGRGTAERAAAAHLEPNPRTHQGHPCGHRSRPTALMRTGLPTRRTATASFHSARAATLGPDH